MKKSMKFATALAGAAVVVVGGTAFTAANTVPTTYAGYGTATVSGVQVKGIDYTVTGTGDAAVITAATFKTQEDLFTLAPLPTVESFLIKSSEVADTYEGECAVSATKTIWGSPGSVDIGLSGFCRGDVLRFEL